MAITGLLGIYSDPASQTARSGVWDEKVHFVGVVFEGLVPGSDPDSADGSEISEVAFFELSHLPSALFPPDVPVLIDLASSEARPFLR